MVSQTTEKKVKFLFRLLPVAGILCLIVSVIMAIRASQFDTVSWVVLGVGIALFLTLFVKAEVANLRYYLHVFVYSALVLGICVVVYLFAQQHTRKIDLTEQKLFSLSDASAKYLKSLDEVTTVTILIPSPDPFKPIEQLYKDETDKVKWVYIDAVKDPIAARKLAEDAHNGDFFVQSGENKKRLNIAELQNNYENLLTNAIVEVTRKDKAKMYFIEGHAEVAYDRPPQQQGSRRPAPSLQAFRDFLTERGIQSEKLDIVKTGNVPQDATVIVLAGPKTDLFGPEARALEEYLDKGGKMLVMVDVPTERGQGEFPNLTTMLSKYGVDLPDKLILDLFSTQAMLSPVQPLMSIFDEQHPITRDLLNRRTYSPLNMARPVLKAELPPQLEFTELVKSSPESWTESLETVMANPRITPPSKDQRGPQPIAVAIGKQAPPRMPNMPPIPEEKNTMRLVIFGSSEPIQDSFLSSSQVGVELMLNSINWLSQREDMIAVPAKQVKGTPIILTGAQLRLIFVFAALLIPGILFFGGVSYSVLRRKS